MNIISFAGLLGGSKWRWGWRGFWNKSRSGDNPWHGERCWHHSLAPAGWCGRAWWDLSRLHHSGGGRGRDRTWQEQHPTHRSCQRRSTWYFCTAAQFAGSGQQPECDPSDQAEHQQAGGSPWWCGGVIPRPGINRPGYWLWERNYTGWGLLWLSIHSYFNRGNYYTPL